MLLKRITNQKLRFFIAIVIGGVITSCGSFQYVGYDNDGIYSSDESEVEIVEQAPEDETTTSVDDSGYYKNYFAENAAQLDVMQEENEIFTDIDAYQGNYVERVQDTTEQRQLYGGWGQNTTSVTINVIDNWGWNNPWAWNAGWGRPWGWNNWGWNNWGWNNWGWNYGWGWNNPWAWNAGWGWNVGWRGGWNNSWAWNGYYRNPNRFAYVNGRRGSLLNRNGLTSVSRRNTAVSRRNYSTSRLSNNSVTRRRSSSTTTRSRSNPTTTRSTRITRPTQSIRSSSPTRSTRGSSTRTRSTTRSSGASMNTRSSSSRSSSSSVRSSSSRRSSSGGRRGRN